MALTDADLKDLGIATIHELGRLKFNQIATRIQNYEVMGRLMKNDQMQIDSGDAISRTIMYDHSGAARMVGMYEPDNVNVVDVLTRITVPWRQTTTNWAYERREVLKNKASPQRVVDLLKVRRAASMISLAELMEAQFWSAPSSSSDDKSIWGVPYWVTAASGQISVTGGFNGGAASGFSDVAGLDPSSTKGARHKNWNQLYTTISKTDAIAKMRTAARKCRFKAPVDIPDYRRGAGDRFRIYVNEATLNSMELVGEQQNENLGRDIASMDDSIAFRKNPIVWVPQLDSNTANPIYMLDMSQFYPVVLSGDYLRETDPEKAPNQHNVFVCHVDLSWNVLCVERRACAVLATIAF